MKANIYYNGGWDTGRETGIVETPLWKPDFFFMKAGIVEIFFYSDKLRVEF